MQIVGENKGPPADLKFCAIALLGIIRLPRAVSDTNQTIDGVVLVDDHLENF